MTLAQTPSKPTCKDVIKACDEALDAKDRALKIADIAITDCQKHAGELTTEINDLRESNESLFRNPVVWFLFGSVATTGAYLLFKK